MTTSHSHEQPTLKNAKAWHDYQIIEEYEVGLVLKGTEVKSLRAGKASLVGTFCHIHQGELFVHNMNISEYEQGNIHNHEPLRTRKLLMHKRDIKKLIGLIERKGYTLIPLRLYFKRGNAKLAIALAQGKKSYDKREDIKKRTMQKDIDRAVKKRV